MKEKAKAFPRLRSEAAERRFWERHDSTPFVDWSKGERATPPNFEADDAQHLAAPAAHARTHQGRWAGFRRW